MALISISSVIVVLYVGDINFKFSMGIFNPFIKDIGDSKF
jgi:hypothetical protein